MSKAIFLIKRKYNKLISSLMTAEDKIDYSLEQISKAIVQQGEVRTKIIMSGSTNLTAAQAKIESNITRLHDKFTELSNKKTEYVVKVAVLKAERDILQSMNSTTGIDFEVSFREVEQEIKQLEAEIDTLNFIHKL